MEKFKSIEEVREYFAGDIYATDTTGIVIDDAGECYAKCSMVIEPKHYNAGGRVMGGAIYTLADLAFAVAANSMGIHTVSASSTCHFLSAAKGSVLYAEAFKIKEGRSTSLYEVKVYDDLGTQVAFVTMSGAHVG